MGVDDEGLSECFTDLPPICIHVVEDNILEEVSAVGVVLLDPSPYLDACAESLALLTVETLPRVTVRDVLTS